MHSRHAARHRDNADHERERAEEVDLVHQVGDAHAQRGDAVADQHEADDQCADLQLQ